MTTSEQPSQSPTPPAAGTSPSLAALDDESDVPARHPEDRNPDDTSDRLRTGTRSDPRPGPAADAEDPAEIGAGARPGRSSWGLLALALGGFAIGTTEFVTMGVLPQIASGLSVSEPQAAHGITAYAIGVVLGVPLLSILGARLDRRAMLLALMGSYGAFNLLTALAPNYGVFVLTRLLDGLPHGVYFGVATLVAASLVAPEQRGRAVASVLLGLSVANIVGVPAGAWLGQTLGWRAAFIACALLAVLAMVLILTFVSATPASRGDSGLSEARDFFARSQVWLTIAAGSIGLAGMFAIYSFIATTVTDISGLPPRAVPLVLLAFGLGLTAGFSLAGEIVARAVYPWLLASGIGTVAGFFLFWLLAPHGWWVLAGAFAVPAIGAFLVTSLQLRLMDVAGEGSTLGAAMNQASLNIGNALGAWAGGLVIAAGYGFRAPGLVAVALAIGGVIAITAAGLLDRRTGT